MAGGDEGHGVESSLRTPATEAVHILYRNDMGKLITAVARSLRPLLSTDDEAQRLARLTDRVARFQSVSNWKPISDCEDVLRESRLHLRRFDAGHTLIPQEIRMVATEK